MMTMMMMMDHMFPIKKTIRELTMFAGSSYLPKHSFTKPLGEDAHFICHQEHTVGVADGVGGWARKGIDSGKYARELMEKTADAVRRNHDQQQQPSSWANIDPSAALREAFTGTVAPGSSTACVLTLRDDNVLHAFNVGDSGFVVIRRGEIVYKSPAQQWRFNCPYQLGERNDQPSVGEELFFQMQACDIIVMGTDGLFDNVFESEIEEMVGGEIERPDVLACRIATFALTKAVDGVCETPFAVAAREAGQLHSGGKYDDITVVVAYGMPNGLQFCNK